MLFRRLTIVCALFALALTGPLAAQDDNQFTDLPVTRAVLFSSGVGYFEHTGSVEGNAAVRLMFKTDQINDVLKSMVLMDLDGGTVTSVTYASDEPVGRALKSFGVDISSDPSLPELLKQLRGAEVKVDNTVGKILTVEEKTQVTGNPPIKQTEYVLRVVTDKGIQSIKLSTVQTLTLTDKKLQAELNEALALLIGARDTNRKPVDIRFVGKGKRRVRIGYLVETPVWKTAYRLDLSDKPLLQGWAIVDNTSDNDWKEVSLSLISGAPISFIQDLYTPLYVDRPEVKPQLYASLRPRLYEEGIERAEKMKKLAEANQLREQLARRKSDERARFAAPGAAAAPAGKGRGLADARFDLSQGVAPVASGATVGELFQFTIHHPVNMGRRRSAMLPLVNNPIKAEKVSIYNQSVHATHPLNGVYVTNSTGMKLMAGPVTVFDGGTYAGDARIGHLSPNDKRLLSYAQDLAVTVDPSARSDNRIVAGRIVRGVLYVSRKYTYTQTYTIKNKAADKRTMIIEHPFNASRKLVAPESYEEKTPNLYRFRVPIDANESGQFVVNEEQTTSQTIAILNASPNSYAIYMKSGEISKDVRDALSKAAKMQNELSELLRQISLLQQQKRGIESGQDRIRRNIQTAGKDTTLGKRLLQKLDEQETEIEKLDQRIDQVQKQVEAKRKEMADYLNELNIGG